MYRSIGLLRSTPLASASMRTAIRPLPMTLTHQLALKRIISTTPPRFEVEKQNLTSSAKDEIKNVGKDIADIISGRSAAAADNMGKAVEVSSHSHAGSMTDDFRTITRDLFAIVPKPAMMFGLAGVIPYLGTSLGTIFLAREASRASQGLNTLTGFDLQTALDSLHIVEHVQITYGAIILSFLGAIHWGMEFSKLGGSQGYSRLALGVIPALYAWPTTFLPHGIALVAQWFGFTGTWMLDQRASRNGWTPPWYATYRFYLSIAVGVSIMATFAGGGFYGAGAGATSAVNYPTRETYADRMSGLKRLEKVGEKNRPSSPNSKVGRVEGTTTSPITLEENTDSYLKLVKAPEEEEEEEDEEEQEAQEEEKQKNAEWQDKRDEHQAEKAPGAMKDTAKDRTGKNEKVQDEEQKK